MLEYVNNQLVLEAVKAFGPGEDSTSPDAETSTATDTSQPAAAGTQPKPAAPGQTSPSNARVLRAAILRPAGLNLGRAAARWRIRCTIALGSAHVPQARRSAMIPSQDRGTSEFY